MRVKTSSSCSSVSIQVRSMWRCAGLVGGCLRCQSSLMSELMALASFILTLEEFLDHCGINKMKCARSNYRTTRARSTLYRGVPEQASLPSGAKLLLFAIIASSERVLSRLVLVRVSAQLRTRSNIPKLSTSRPKTISYAFWLLRDPIS